MSRKIVAAATAPILLLGLVALNSLPAHAFINGTEVQVTTDTAAQFDPAIDGNYIVFTDNRLGNSDIYLYDIAAGTETPIAATEEEELLNDISGNKVVYTLARRDR